MNLPLLLTYYLKNRRNFLNCYVFALFTVCILFLSSSVRSEIVLPPSLTEGAIVEKSIKISERYSFFEGLRSEILLPEGKWNVRLITNVNSSHQPPIAGINIWMDKTINQYIQEVMTVLIYPYSDKSWTDNCTPGIAGSMMLNGIDSDCYQLQVTGFMTNLESAPQTEVRKRWDSAGLMWTNTAISFSSIHKRPNLGPTRIHYALAENNHENAKNHELHSSKIDQKPQSNKKPTLVNWARNFYELNRERVYAYKSNKQSLSHEVASLAKLLAHQDYFVGNKPNTQEPIDQKPTESTKINDQIIAFGSQLQGGNQIGKRVALVIGNSAYEIRALDNPVNDARAISTKLKSLGFSVITRENLRLKEIGGTLRDLRNRIKPGDEVVIFYAGHGLQVNGINYLPVIDADIQGEEDVPLNSLSVNALLNVLEDSKAGVKLLFIDACRDNPYARSFRSASGGNFGKVGSAPSGTLIHYATRPGSLAADGKKGGNGLYTHHLLKWIDTPQLAVESMHKRVALGVEQDSQGKQEPWSEGQLKGEFYFNFKKITTLSCTNEGAGSQCDTTKLEIVENQLKEFKKDGLWATFSHLDMKEKYPSAFFLGIDKSRNALIRVECPETSQYCTALWGWKQSDITKIMWNPIPGKFVNK